MNISPGQRYIHFRNKKLYEIIGIGILTTDDTSVVIYKGLYDDANLGNEPLFVRPLEEFRGKVVDDGGHSVDRFQVVA